MVQVDDWPGSMVSSSRSWSSPDVAGLSNVNANPPEFVNVAAVGEPSMPTRASAVELDAPAFHVPGNPAAAKRLEGKPDPGPCPSMSMLMDCDRACGME